MSLVGQSLKGLTKIRRFDRNIMTNEMANKLICFWTLQIFVHEVRAGKEVGRSVVLLINLLYHNNFLKTRQLFENVLMSNS